MRLEPGTQDLKSGTLITQLHCLVPRDKDDSFGLLSTYKHNMDVAVYFTGDSLMYPQYLVLFPTLQMKLPLLQTCDSELNAMGRKTLDRRSS